MSIEDDPKFKAFMAGVEKRGRVIHRQFVEAHIRGQTDVIEVGAAQYAAVRIVNTLIRNKLLTKELFDETLASLQSQMAAKDREKA